MAKRKAAPKDDAVEAALLRKRPTAASISVRASGPNTFCSGSPTGTG